MQDRSPKLPCDFLCFCCKRPSWIMLDITFWVVSSTPFGIFKKYWSPIILCEGCNSSNCGGAAFSQKGETGGRKLTVLCQKTEPVETSCKHKLTANGGTNGLGILSFREKKPKLLHMEYILRELEDYLRFHVKYICFSKMENFMLHFLFFFFVEGLKRSWTAPGSAEHKVFPPLHFI